MIKETIKIQKFQKRFLMYLKSMVINEPISREDNNTIRRVFKSKKK